MMYGRVSLVVQFSVKLVSSHDDRSASAISTSPHWTKVIALFAMRVLVFDLLRPGWLEVEIDRLVVPSVMPNPKYALSAAPARSASVWVLPVSVSLEAGAGFAPVAPAAACTTEFSSSDIPRAARTAFTQTSEASGIAAGGGP